MEKLLVKGEKLVISRINDPSQQMVFEFVYNNPKKVIYDMDIFVLLMDDRGRVLKDHIIFYGNPITDEGSINYDEVYESNQVKKMLSITLSKIPDSIQTICLACSIYCKDKSKLEGPHYMDFKMDAQNKTLRSHMFISQDKIDLSTDQVFIMGEIYKYRDTWKYNAVKQNLDEGFMISLKKLYGLEVY